MQTFEMSLPGNANLPTRYDRIIIDGMEYVSVKEARELTGYSEQYIRRLLRNDRIKAVMKGPMYWIELDSLMAYKKEMDLLGDEKFNPRRDKD